MFFDLFKNLCNKEKMWRAMKKTNTCIVQNVDKRQCTFFIQRSVGNINVPGLDKEHQA
jgi:hypothetical protein